MTKTPDMKAKRYPSPKVRKGELKFQRGKIDGDVDMCTFFGEGVSKRASNLVFHYLTRERPNIRLNGADLTFDKSFIDALEDCGFDLDTLRFSIKKKEQA